MAPTKTTKTSSASTTQTAKKEKVHHPASRKASQLNRKAVRKGKLGNLNTVRAQKHSYLADVYGFFFHALPPPPTSSLSLEELHTIVGDVWITRHDAELQEEREKRRKGRPKSVKEIKLEDMKIRDVEEYRTGLEVIDLTHPPTVTLFRKWDQKEVAFIDLLRFIRISSSDPTSVVISRPGRHHTIVSEEEKVEEEEDVEMR